MWMQMAGFYADGAYLVLLALVIARRASASSAGLLVTLDMVSIYAAAFQMKRLP